MRTPGAWVGNGAEAFPQWNTILEKQMKIKDTWIKSHLSFKGKELVAKALLQSKALFLATINGMPLTVAKQMQKIIKDLIWENKERGLMRQEEITADRSSGGLGIPNIEKRLEAIQITWLKKWLTPKEKRPVWAFLTDEIIKQNIPDKMEQQTTMDNTIMA